MIGISTIQFSFHLLSAILMGGAVGLERQWRQRMAGTRTNAPSWLREPRRLSCAVSFSTVTLQRADASFSYVVSGVGFLGAGVIFKDVANVCGLNTAATIWCSAAIGALCGLGALNPALIFAVAVLLTNLVLRPLAYRLPPVLPEATPVKTLYKIKLACTISAAARMRALLLSTISQLPVTLQAIHSKQVAQAIWLTFELR